MTASTQFTWPISECGKPGLSPAQIQIFQTARDFIAPTRTAILFSVQLTAPSSLSLLVYAQQNEISVWLHHLAELHQSILEASSSEEGFGSDEDIKYFLISG